MSASARRWRELWRAPWLLALAAGLIAALAHPPFGVLPGLLGYALLLYLIDRTEQVRPLRSAFWRGWLAGAAYFGLGVWWVAEAFFVDAKTYGWMAPFAIVLLAGGLALFWGAAASLYRAIAPRGLGRVLVFAGAFALLEWLRGHVLTGFPWNLPGETWKAGSAPSQLAAVVGAYGLTWITVAIASSPAVLADPAPRRRRAAVLVAAAAALAGLYVYGIARTPAPASAGTGIRVRIVQPNIEQAIKYDERYFREMVGRYLALTAAPYNGVPAQVVIWPEGSIPSTTVEDLLTEGSWTERAIAGAMSEGQTLVAGGLRFGVPAGAEADRIAPLNILFVARKQGGRLRVTHVYDKHRLVPFGEFLPMEGLLAPLGVKKLVQGEGDSFGSGPPPAPISASGLPAFQPLICYESLFPGFTRAGAAKAGRRPSLIVNISNDSWFGETSGPWQLLNLASYRSIEEGLPMVRSTPTGISAVVDAYGRVCCAPMLKLGQAGVIDASLSAPSPPTAYAIYGDLIFWALVTLSALLAGGYFVRERKLPVT